MSILECCEYQGALRIPPWTFTILRSRQRYISTTTYFNSLFSWFFFLFFSYSFSSPSSYFSNSISLPVSFDRILFISVCPLFACFALQPVLRLPLVHVTAHKRHLSNGSPEVILLLASIVLSPPSSNSILPPLFPCFLITLFFFFPLLILSFLPSSNSPFFFLPDFPVRCVGVVYLGWMRSSCGPGKYGSSTYQVYGASQCMFPQSNAMAYLKLTLCSSSCS